MGRNEKGFQRKDSGAEGTMESMVRQEGILTVYFLMLHVLFYKDRVYRNMRLKWPKS